MKSAPQSWHKEDSWVSFSLREWGADERKDTVASKLEEDVATDARLLDVSISVGMSRDKSEGP